MKLIDENGRVFGKISWIDLTILILVAAMALFLFYRGFMRSELKENVGQEKNVTVTVFLPKLTSFQLDALEEGPARLQRTGRNANVEVMIIEAVPAQEPVETKDGTIVIASSPNRFDAKVTVTGPGEVMRDRIMIGTIEVKVGTDLRLLTKYFEGVGVIYSIDE
ncbi:DUF4330 domain-containing protein [Alkaliphilus peptidifermentans]|uniref:DUF4330 domain-containing protein n=1 Tax=Alkaliphilus peptidifermentans DSM 18978 TaxID=1120976 RepID=A0A1G5GEU4_9FIRM|nr:DUF4330 domain-containing protein [Alkaliphilus peptidifermentans]SCY49218.1 protein of unknown function [Alkaliphilus peptidifermentans DSM 18978]